MKLRKSHCLALIVVCLLVWLVYSTTNRTLHNQKHATNLSSSPSAAVAVVPTPPRISLAIVACGDRLNEALTNIKSVLIFNVDRQPLRFFVFAEDVLIEAFRQKLSDWQEITHHVFTFELLPLTFPAPNEAEWKKLFKPCASQRLFIPTVLQNVDSVIYTDTDVLHLSPISETWRRFHTFNASQIAAMTPEHEDANAGWYNRFARHPFYRPLGVNSGVMLMNLTRMRDANWTGEVLPIYREYRLQLVWGDQDIINIFFAFHPERLAVLPCEFNYRSDHCMYLSVCEAPDGVKIMHGNRGLFHSNSQPIFRQVYETIEAFRFGDDPFTSIVQAIDLAAAAAPDASKSNCDKVIDKVMRIPKELFKELEYFNVT